MREQYMLLSIRDVNYRFWADYSYIIFSRFGLPPASSIERRRSSARQQIWLSVHWNFCSTSKACWWRFPHSRRWNKTPKGRHLIFYEVATDRKSDNLKSRYTVIILFTFQMEGNKDTEKKLSRWKKMWLSISMKTKIRFSYRRGSKSNHPTDKEIE